MKIQVLPAIKLLFNFFLDTFKDVLDLSLEQITQETENLMLQQIAGQTLSHAAQNQVSAQEKTQQPAATIEPESIVSTTNADLIRTNLLNRETNWKEAEDSELDSRDRYFRLIHSSLQLSNSRTIFILGKVILSIIDWPNNNSWEKQLALGCFLFFF